MSRFQQIAHNIVDKYCSMPLPYKPGLYSIYWESTCRLTGLVDELHSAADKEIKKLAGETPKVIQKAENDMDNVITHSLIAYTEKIFSADYPDSEQPGWMIEIAMRLLKDRNTTH